MAKTDIGPKISVEGESEYRKQMQRIVQQQKEYAAELQSATANLDRNATVQEKATTVAAVLRKQIANQESALKAQQNILSKVTSEVEDAELKTSRYQTAINKTTANLGNLKSRLYDAENGLGEFADKTKDAEDAVESLNKTDVGANTFDNIEKSVAKGELLASAFKTVGKAALNAAMDVAKTGIAYNAQIEQYQVAFSNMLGSETAAVELLDQIKEDAAKTPFDTQGLVKANQYLISTGVNAESSRKTILALGDAVSATGGGNEELSRMAQNLQQIKNAGKATAADIKQFAYAGIDVYGILADYTGKSTEEVQKMTVTYDLLTAALESAAEEGGRYYDAMSTQSKTINGQWNTLKDNATQLAGLLTEDLTTALGKVVSRMNDITVAAAEAYKEDGWIGLINRLTGVETVANRVGAIFAGIAAQAKEIFVNGNLDELKAFFNPSGNSEAYKKAYSQYLSNKNAGKKDEKYWKEYGERLKKQYGLDNKNETPVVVPPDTNSGSSPKKAAADQKKLADSVTETNTQLLEGTGNIVGAIKQVTETADNTYNVYDGTTGKLKGTTQETAQTVTQTWTEMVNGIQKNYKKVVTLLDGVEQSSKTTVENVNQTLSSSSTNTEKLSGVEGVEGTLNRTTQTTQEIQKVWNESTGQMEDKVVSTGKVVTDTFNRVKDGALEAVTQIKTFDEAGNLLSTKEQTANVERSNTSTSIKSERIYGQEGVVGALDRTTQTTSEMQKVWNETTQQFEEKMVDTGKTVTETFVRMNDGVAESVTKTSTYIGNELVSVSESAEGLKTEIKGVQGTVGSFSQFILDLDTKLGGLEQAASNLSKSPLGSWFSDLSKGYRASDSFFDNIDVPGLIVGGLVSAATGYMKGGIPGAIASAGLSIVGNLIGTNLSGLANESNNWGADLVTGMANGMKEAGGFLATAAKGLAETVKSFLHFSRPDVGPLREYEQWMPDMVKGMAKGITDNAYMLRDAVRGLSGQMETQLTYDVGRASSALTTAYNTRRISMGGVSISIYPQEGQDAEEIAQYTIDKLQMMINSEASANGEIPVF